MGLMKHNVDDVIIRFGFGALGKSASRVGIARLSLVRSTVITDAQSIYVYLQIWQGGVRSEDCESHICIVHAVARHGEKIQSY